MTDVTLSPADTHDLLSDLVSTPSVSGAESACASVLVEYFENAGRNVYLDAVGNVRAPGNDAVLLTSHLDTVPGSIPVRVEDGALWGRGSVDAKGALTAMAIAAVQTGVSFVGVVGEESDSRGAWHLVEDRPEPDVLINGEPSGWDAITLGYRGLLSGHYRTESEGVHSSRPENNAIQDAFDWWGRIEALYENDSDASAFSQVTAKPVRISSGPTDEGRSHEVEIDAEFRLPPSTSPETVRARVEAELATGSMTWERPIPPVVQSQRTAVARTFRAAIRSKGGDPAHLQKTGTSDMNIYATTWECPMVTYGPGDSALDHTPEERLQLQSFEQSIDVLQDVCTTLTQS